MSDYVKFRKVACSLRPRLKPHANQILLKIDSKS